MTSTRLDKIKLLVFDFDGVFTDNRVLVLQDGREAVLCSRSDGLGIERLRETGFPMVVLSSEKNPVVSARCRKLKLRCLQGHRQKLGILKQEAVRSKVKLSEICYVGNDVNDIPCLQVVGLPVCVADAYPEVKRLSRWVLKNPGGHGAVREVCDTFYFLRHKQEAR